MKLAILSVSRQGFALSKQLARHFPEAAVYTSGPWGDPKTLPIEPDLKALTGMLFRDTEALIFIMASGIAVRMVAPWLKDKASDPAVLVLDDQGRWVIPLVSGHLGGANALAQVVARQLGAEAVITTATDGRGLVAVDMLAQQHSWTISSLEGAKKATASLLEGEAVEVWSWRSLEHPLPEGYRGIQDSGGYHNGWRLIVTPFRHIAQEKELVLIPRCITLGMGCRRDIPFEAVQQLVQAGLSRLDIDPRAVSRIASIDLKADEPALNQMARSLGVPLVTYSAEALKAVSGSFEASDFVFQTTGVGAVSEPAGALASGGRCLLPKQAENGVTLSIWEDC